MSESAANENTPRIGSGTMVAMLIIAVILDLLQILLTFLLVIPVVGWALSLVLVIYIAMVAIIGFGVWFKVAGVRIFGGKNAGRKALAAVGGPVLESVPLLDDLPLITVSVWNIIEATNASNAAPETPPVRRATNDNASQEETVAHNTQQG